MKQEFQELKQDLKAGNVKKDLRGEGQTCCLCIE